jgi:enoyl-CoA hydratase/carnithine racemase
MTEPDVLVSSGASVCRITLNRPSRLNAFTVAMCRLFERSLREAIDDERVRVIVVTGSGRAFCAGADIGVLHDLVAAPDWEAARELVQVGADIVSLLAHAPKPVIAAVNGPAAGGGANLALACDIRVASARASVGQTFGGIGLHPDWGGTWLLPRLVGLGKALELVLTGEMIDAHECLRAGLVNRVVDPEQLTTVVDELAARLAARPPLALAAAKRALRQSLEGRLPDALAEEVEVQARLLRTADAREGIRAFLDKREPAFSGR